MVSVPTFMIRAERLHSHVTQNILLTFNCDLSHHKCVGFPLSVVCFCKHIFNTADDVLYGPVFSHQILMLFHCNYY